MCPIQYCQVIRPVPRLCVVIRNKYWVLRGWVVSPPPNSQAGGPPTAGCPQLLIQYIRSYPSYLEAVSSIRNQRTRHALVTVDPLNIFLSGKEVMLKVQDSRDMACLNVTLISNTVFALTVRLVHFLVYTKISEAFFTQHHGDKVIRVSNAMTNPTILSTQQWYPR
jgi:hypothetical protein